MHTDYFIQGHECVSTQAEDEGKKAGPLWGKLRAPLRVCCFLPLSVHCGRQMQSVYFYFSPWIPGRGHFLHRSLRDRSDSPTPVRSAVPAGGTRAAPDAAARIFTLVNHVQTSPFYHHHCRRFLPPRLLHRFLLMMAV